MTDRELLEQAAKAAGYEIQGKVEKMIAEHGHYAGGFVITNNRGGSSAWNPLTDDGDALRLAIKLHLEIISVYFYGSENCQRPTTIRRSGGGMTEDLIVSFPTYTESFEQYDPYAATRRAIVRAAAEVGKSVK